MIKIIALLNEIGNEMNSNGIINILDSNIKDIILKHNEMGFIEHLCFEDILNNLINERLVLELSQIINCKLNTKSGIYIVEEYLNYINEVLIFQNSEILNQMIYNEICKLRYELIV